MANQKISVSYHDLNTRIDFVRYTFINAKINKDKGYMCTKTPTQMSLSVLPWINALNDNQLQTVNGSTVTP